MKNKHRRLLILLGVLDVVMAAVIIFVCARFITNSVHEDRIRTATGAARSASQMVNGDKVDFWLANGADEEYNKTAENLRTILYNTPYLEYLYVYKIKEDGCHVVFDFDSPSASENNSEDDNVVGTPASVIGDVVGFDETFLPYVPTLLEGGRIDTIESNDSYGWLLTQYEPIYDSQGKCVAYAGTDISMAGVSNYINRIMVHIILISLIFLIAIIIIGFRIATTFRRAEELEALLERRERDHKLLTEIIESFAKVIDLKDPYTQGHSTRVAQYTTMLAEVMGYDEETIERFYDIALLHDIGKIGIPDSILNKTGKLSDEEFSAIKSHTSRGYEVLKDISLMPDIAVGAYSHHERPDGKGYPQGISGDEIPTIARIIAVADTFDAMYSDRPYRARMNFDKAVSIIKDGSGTQFAPEVVDAFMKLVENGKLRAVDDTGGGSTENIENIKE